MSTDGPVSDDRVRPLDIEEEMRTSYLTYAMSVIVSRALPDARDGMKPVHRRILFAMNEMGLHADRPYKKCGRIAGDVGLGQVARELLAGDGAQVHLIGAVGESQGAKSGPGLGQRGVDAPVAAEPLLKACRRAEDAAQPAHVLAHDDDIRVATHFLEERIEDRRAIGDGALSHGRGS